MHIRRSEPFTRFLNTVRQAADAGSRAFPEYLYEQHYELSHQIGIPEIYQPRAWQEDHRILCATAAMAGGLAGALAAVFSMAAGEKPGPGP